MGEQQLAKHLEAILAMYPDDQALLDTLVREQWAVRAFESLCPDQATKAVAHELHSKLGGNPLTLAPAEARRLARMMLDEFDRSKGSVFHLPFPAVQAIVTLTSSILAIFIGNVGLLGIARLLGL